MTEAELPVVRGEDLSRHYSTGDVIVKALDSVSFDVLRREFIAVIGHSGSGKSTLLNLVGGMDRPTGGRVLYGDTDLGSLNDNKLADYRRQVVGFVFQFFNLIPSLTAYENVELAASVSENAMEVAHALDLVGLTDRATHFPSQMSGGEQQRVSIARAIVKNPALLLCDEPTGALDTGNGLMIVRLLARMRETIGCPVITITHNPEIGRIADRVFYMRDGMIERVQVNDEPLPAEELVW